MGVPGDIGEWELEFFGEDLGDVETTVVEAGQGSSRSAELQDDAA